MRRSRRREQLRQGDLRQQLLGRFGIAKDIDRHLGCDPAGGDAVSVDALCNEFRREAFGEADESAFGGGVVGVEGFAALTGGGADEHDVAFGVAGCGLGLRLGLHLGYCGSDDAEDAVEVGSDGFSPLTVGHGGDGLVV